MRRTGRSVRKMVRYPSKDIISGMPKNVIEMILEVLPMRDAVRTSVLSRNWRYRWAAISQLVFDAQFFKSLDNKFLSDLQLKNIINKLLLLHIGSIRKFTLHVVPELISSLNNDLSQWLLFLSRNSLKEFTLHASYLSSYHKLGLQLYSCHGLTHLNLCNCKLCPPAAFEGFPNLTTLKLRSVFSADSDIRNIISGCPLLEKLSMEWCKGIDNLSFTAPNIKYLHVKKVVGLKTICLNSVMKVTTLSISFHDAPWPKPSIIEKLVFDDHIFEFLVVGGVPKRLSSTMDNLKNISFDIDFNDVARVSCTLCMIRSSPNLSLLEISGLPIAALVSSSFALIQDPTFMADDFDHNCSLSQLRIVKLKCIRVLKTEMALIKFLLAHSPLLEKMFIHPNRGIDKDVSFAMCKELMQFGRASPKAAIIYLDPLPLESHIGS